MILFKRKEVSPIKKKLKVCRGGEGKDFRRGLTHKINDGKNFEKGRLKVEVSSSY